MTLFKSLLFLIVVSFLFPACSTFKVADNYVSNKLEKANCEQKTIIVDSNSVEYWDNQTEKPVLVLIHGLGSTAKLQYQKQVKDLKDDYRIIIPSLLYFGKTIPLGKNKYDVQDQVNLINGLLDSLNITNAHVCGASYGGLIAAEFTRLHPEKVNKLILFDAVLKFYTDVEINNMCSTYEVTDFRDLFVPNNPKDVKRLFSVAYKNPPPIPSFLLNSFQKEVFQKNQPHMRLLITHLHDNMPFYQKQEYTFPNKTLLIWGEGDDVAPISTAKLLNEHLTNSELKIIPKTKHMPNLEKPKKFNRLVMDFLK